MIYLIIYLIGFVITKIALHIKYRKELYNDSLYFQIPDILLEKVITQSIFWFIFIWVWIYKLVRR